MSIGFAVLMAAASITSMPPAVDLVDDRVTLAELAARIAPAMPRLESPDHATLGVPALQGKLDEERRRQQASAQALVPGSETLPPRNVQDIAWSEYNHRWAGLLAAAMGLAALAQRSGRAPWARHWPLLLMLLAAFLFLRADPEVWPMGNIGLVESLKDPEVAQHRLFVIVIVVFALFEWRVRTARAASHNAARVFPLLTAVGGTLLLTHSHALGNVKEELLIEMTHLPIAVLGIAAGWTRWLEVEAPNDEGRWSGWIWPVCFAFDRSAFAGLSRSMSAAGPRPLWTCDENRCSKCRPRVTTRICRRSPRCGAPRRLLASLPQGANALHWRSAQRPHWPPRPQAWGYNR